MANTFEGNIRFDAVVYKDHAGRRHLRNVRNGKVYLRCIQHPRCTGRAVCSEARHFCVSIIFISPVVQWLVLTSVTVPEALFFPTVYWFIKCSVDDCCLTSKCTLLFTSTSGPIILLWGMRMATLLFDLGQNNNLATTRLLFFFTSCTSMQAFASFHQSTSRNNDWLWWFLTSYECWIDLVYELNSTLRYLFKKEKKRCLTTSARLSSTQDYFLIFTADWCH